MSEGADESCPDSNPYCIDGVCEECNDAAPDFCGGVDPDAPACHPGSGLCLGCVGNSDCATGVCGDAYACVSCTQHSECLTACDLRTHACLMTNTVVWVDPTDCEPPGFGEEDDPYCTLADAVANIAADQSGVIHLRSSSPLSEPIELRGLANRTLVVLGEGNPSLNGDPTAIIVGTTSAIFVDGVRITTAQETGATCTAQAELWFTDVVFEGNATAISGTNCRRVVVERSKILGSTGDAIVIDGGELRILASALVDNGTAGAATAAVRASSTEVNVRYSTFADNRGLGTNASIACANATGEIRNSVVVSTDRPSLGCGGATLRTSVVGGEAEGEGVVVVDTYDAGWFQDVTIADVRIVDPDSSPFRDVAVWGDGDPLRDISGTRRLAHPGRVEFAGAAQP
jgi:hypothetical protein